MGTKKFKIKQPRKAKWIEEGYQRGHAAGRLEGKNQAAGEREEAVELARAEGEDRGAIRIRRQVVWMVLGCHDGKAESYEDILQAREKFSKVMQSVGMRSILEVIGVSPALTKSISFETDPETIKKLVRLTLGLTDEFLAGAREDAIKLEDEIKRRTAVAVPVNDNSVPSLYERYLALSGDTLKAIQCMHVRTVCSLFEAKRAIDEFVAGWYDEENDTVTESAKRAIG